MRVAYPEIRQFSLYLLDREFMWLAFRMRIYFLFNRVCFLRALRM